MICLYINVKGSWASVTFTGFDYLNYCAFFSFDWAPDPLSILSSTYSVFSPLNSELSNGIFVLCSRFGLELRAELGFSTFTSISSFTAYSWLISSSSSFTEGGNSSDLAIFLYGYLCIWYKMTYDIIWKYMMVTQYVLQDFWCLISLLRFLVLYLHSPFSHVFNSHIVLVCLELMISSPSYQFSYASYQNYDVNYPCPFSSYHFYRIHRAITRYM